MFSSIRALYKDTYWSEKSYISLLIYIWGAVIFGFFIGALSHVNFLLPIHEYISDSIFYILFVFSIPYMRGYVKTSEVVLYILIAIYYFLNYVFYPNNVNTLDMYIVRFLCLALPMFFVGKSLNIYKYSDAFYRISVLSILFSALYYMFYVQQSNYAGSAEVGGEIHEMGASYLVLPHVLFVLYYTFKRFNLFRFLLSVLGGLLICSFGTRGPLMCLLLFVTLYLLVFKKYKHPIFSKIIIVSLFLIVFCFLNEIMMFMSFVTKQVGMSDRIFQIALEGNFVGGEASSDGRLDYVGMCYSLLDQKDSIFGFGLGGTYKYIFTYPHNLLIELHFSFGYIIGTLLFLLLIGVMLKKLVGQKDTLIRVFTLLMFCSFFVKLFMSGTFLGEPMLYLLLGFCCNRLTKSECHKRKMYVINQI